MGCGCGSSINFTGGSPKGVPMEKETIQELLKKANRYNIVGRHDMRKADLIKAIRSKQAEVGKTLASRRR